MTDAAAYASIFLSALPEDRRAPLVGREGLAEELATAFDAGRTAWPGVELSPEDFLTHLAERIEVDTEGTLELAHVADLYLSCACARGDARALATFDARFLAPLSHELPPLGADKDIVAEVQQEMRRRLLVSGEATGISGYRGRGSLAAWLRVTAVRDTLRMLKARRKHAPVGDEALVDLFTPHEDPALAYAKRIHREDFGEALREAISRLPVRERNLLRYQLLDDLGVDAIAALYNVHRVTVSRWLGRARAAVMSRTRRTLMKKYNLGKEDADSLLRAVRSQMDLSLDRILGPTRE